MKRETKEWQYYAKAVVLLGAAMAAVAGLASFTSPGQYGKRITKVEGRVDVIEEEINVMDTDHASDEEVFKHYNFRLDNLDTSVNSIDDKLDRLLERTP